MDVRLRGSVMDAEQIRRSLSRIGHEIVERNKGTADLVIVGVLHKGDLLARRLAAALQVPCGVLDVTSHRDDLHLRPAAEQQPSELPIRPDYVGKNIATADSERVEVLLAEEDGLDAVVVLG